MTNQLLDIERPDPCPRCADYRRQVAELEEKCGRVVRYTNAILAHELNNTKHRREARLKASHALMPGDLTEKGQPQ